jgi:hypothetical protein
MIYCSQPVFTDLIRDISMPSVYKFLFFSLSFFLALNNACAEIVSFQCGGTQFEVKAKLVRYMGIKDDFYYMFTLYGRAHGKTRDLYTVDGDHLSISCVKDYRGNEQLLFSRDCGGSACVREYGIIDPVSFKFLLRPPAANRENSRLAEKILGVSMPSKRGFSFSFYTGLVEKDID